MAVPSTPVAAASRLARGWLIVLGLCLAFIAWDTAAVFRHLEKISSATGINVSPPTVDVSSLTGWSDGRRQLVYPGRSLDGLHWVMQTQQMLHTGDWRMRHLQDENAPHGRELHWGSPFRWWLGVCAWADLSITGAPLGLAAERSAVLANPILLALLLLILVPWTARVFGPWPAAFLAVFMTSTMPFTTLFAADNPDHHGLIQFGATIGIFALLAGGSGWIQTGAPTAARDTSRLPSLAVARRNFVLSALSLGLGLWVSAVTIIPVMVGLGLGALAGAWSGRNQSNAQTYQPTLWRLWGFVGGLVSFLAYLLEYFPHHLGWRLEVNHPVYAIAWIAAGEMLAQLTATLAQGKILPGAGAWPRILIALLGVALPAVLLVVGGSRFFTAGEGFFWSLIHDYVPECQSLLQAWQISGLNYSTVAQSLPMLSLPVVWAWLILRSTPATLRASTAIPFAVTGLIWLLGFRELRWWNVGFGFLPLVLLPVLSSQITSFSPTLRWGLVSLFLPGLGVTIQQCTRRDVVTAEDFQGLAERDIAHLLRDRLGQQPIVVLSGPATTSRLLYFASAKGLGTAYWENHDGLKTAAAIYAAPSPETARVLLRRTGVTHLILLSWDDFAAPYVRLARQLPRTAAITDAAFGLDLQHSDRIPPWLRELPSPLPDHPAFKGHRVRLFEITDQTEPVQVLVRHANRQLELGNLPEALALRAGLAKFSSSISAQIMLARLGANSNDSALYAAAMELIESLHQQIPSLEPDEQVELIKLYLAADLTGEAQARLETVLPLLDEAALRQLRPISRWELLALTAQLRVPWPDPRLHEFLRTLGGVPPEK